MPWNVSKPVDLKMEFITRLDGGERMACLCREYGIARKTGYELQRRYKERGRLGLVARSRAPLHIPHKTAPEIEALLVKERRRHPTWGPKKLKEVLEDRSERTLPSSSTIGDILLRRGLVERRLTRRRHKPVATELGIAVLPNDIWCVDYKGQFRLGDSSYCYPLTITDQASRFILGCEGMAAISDEASREVFAEVFHVHGLPSVMRSDNGVPFASSGLAGLTKLSVYWLLLGIRLERIRPGHPQENGRHERMHRTLKRETTRPPRYNLLQQQQLFDRWVEEFNEERPHEALKMKRPANVYRSSRRKCPATLPEPTYPAHDDTIPVSSRGNIWVAGTGRVYLGTALANQLVGIREEEDGRWLVTFTTIDLGHVMPNKTFTPTPPVDN